MMDAQSLCDSQVSARTVLAGKNLVVALPDTRLEPWNSKAGFLEVGAEVRAVNK
jgi:hypothetical protein